MMNCFDTRQEFVAFWRRTLESESGPLLRLICTNVPNVTARFGPLP